MGRMSEIAAEREADAGPEQEPDAPRRKKRGGISQEEAKRMLDELHNEGMTGIPRVTSKTSIHHMRSGKFSLNKEPKK